MGPLESFVNVKSYSIMNNEWQEERQLERQNEQRCMRYLRSMQQVSSESLLAAHGFARGEEHASELDRDLHEIFVRVTR